MIPPFSTVTPGGQLSAAELNRAFAELERQTRLTVAPPLEIIKDGGGFRLRLDFTKTFWAELTDQGEAGSGSGSAGGAPYAWREGRFGEGGAWVVLTTGRRGTLAEWPAYEINGLDTPLDTNGHATRVRMWETDFPFVVFRSGGEGGSGSGGGECCDSGVTLKRFRCQAGQLQYTNVCTRLESGHFLNRDEQCRVMLGECGCSQGSVLVYEYEFDPTLTDPLVVTRLALSRECGTLVLRANDGRDCEAMPERAVCGTGVKVRTLECKNGVISPTWVYLTLECGKIRKRTADCQPVHELCCDAPTDCIRTSDGPTWHDAGCPCVGATCGNGLLPQQIDFLMFGYNGCEPAGDTGVATWTNDVSASFPGNATYGPGGSYDHKPGWIFHFSVNGHPVVLAFVCLSGTAPIDGFPFGIWAIIHTIDGTATGTEGPSGTVIVFPTADPADPGHIEFTLNYEFGGLPCHGDLYFVTSTAS